MIRLFTAVELPEEVRAQLALLEGGLPGAKWVAPENLHLTLRFIGEVDEGRMEDIDAALRGVRAPKFELALAGVGYFGNKRRARTLWAGVERAEAAAHLYGKVESALVRGGLEPEQRKYTPHVTLARLRDPPWRRLEAYVADHNLFRTAPFEVKSFTLFSSYLARNGAIHRPEAVYKLEGADDDQIFGVK